MGENLPLPRVAEEIEAQRYADLIVGPLRGDWPELNAAIIQRFSITAFKRIKRRAWEIAEGRPR